MSEVHTVAIDIIDQSIPIGNDRDIAVIHKPNPVYGYEATAYEVFHLIQIPIYYVYEAGTSKIINGDNYYEYFPEEAHSGGVTPDKVQEMIDDTVDPVDERLVKVEEEIEHIDASSLGEYIRNEEVPRGRVVYITPGQLYQATKKFTSNNDPSLTIEQAFAADVAAGNLTPVTDADVASLDDRVVVIEEWKPGVDDDIEELQQAIISAEEMEYHNTYDEFPEEGKVDITYVDNSTGKTYIWNKTTSEYELMNTNNIIDGSIFNSIL